MRIILGVAFKKEFLNDKELLMVSETATTYNLQEGFPCTHNYFHCLLNITVNCGFKLLFWLIGSAPDSCFLPSMKVPGKLKGNKHALICDINEYVFFSCSSAVGK